MSLKFRGSLETLTEILAECGEPRGRWIRLEQDSARPWQWRSTVTRAILLWWPQTGTVLPQGDGERLEWMLELPLAQWAPPPAVPSSQLSLF